jgi:hypothetical protein
MSFGALRLCERHKGLRLASRHPRGVSEGILEGSVPMVRPGLKKVMVGVPKIMLSWMKQRSGDFKGMSSPRGSSMPQEPSSWGE